MQRTHDFVDRDGTVVHEVRRSAWSPAQFIDIVAGVLLVVLGGVGLARAGINFSDLTFAHAQVAGLGVTPLSAVAELAAGVVLLAGGAFAVSSKVVSAIVGVVMLAFGLVAALDQAPLHRAWDFGRTNGIVCAIVGAILLVSSMASPVFRSRRRVVVEHASASQRQGPVPGSSAERSQPVSPDPLQMT